MIYLQKYRKKITGYFILSIASTWSTINLSSKRFLKSETFAIPTNLNEINNINVLGLSSRLVAQHIELFKTYLNELNFIRNELDTLGTSDRVSRQYSQTRELKLEEADKRNALIYHSLYFQNLSTTYATNRRMPGAETTRLIKASFGSMENFKQQFMLLGGSAKGWMTVCLPIEEPHLRFFIADQHNTSTPLLAFPIIVIDLYEHAYLIDFNTPGSMQQYLQLMWNQLDWEIIEDRLVKSIKAVEVLQTPLVKAPEQQPESSISQGADASSESNSSASTEEKKK